MAKSSIDLFEPLASSEIVYRAILRQQWIDEDTGKLKADAYFLRTNEPGISVNIASVCTPQQCAQRFRKCYGIASLEIGLIREIGLDVEQDSSNHANIIGLPHKEDNLVEAERLAGLLAKRSRIIRKSD